MHRGSTKLSAAAYKSSQNEPLWAFDDSTVIIDVLPLMLLGIVNRLYIIQPLKSGFETDS